MKQLPQRIQSIDVLRAITMFLMIFVNDVAGVSQIPKWIEHTAADYDGMGFSDLIFPSFLFIVGLSLPLAIKGRIKKGDGPVAVLAYIVLRSFALIVMGFFHVNLENYNDSQAVLTYPVYTIILTIGFFLVWLDYPKSISRNLKYTLVIVGVLIIALMAYWYRGGNAENPEGLEPHWWGILGIIGWAYLFSAVAYYVTKGKLICLISAFLIFAAINVTTHLDLWHPDLWQIGDASSITLMLGGAVTSTLYAFYVSKSKEKELWLILTLLGVLSVVFGFVIRPYAGGISKIYSTPAWVFICMGITLLMFELLIYLVDMIGKKNWFTFIKPAGTSTLTCYLVPYFLYSLLNLIHFEYPSYFNYGTGGIIRSLLVAFIVIRMVALMEKGSLRLRV